MGWGLWGDKGIKHKTANEPNPSGFGYMLITQFVLLLFLLSPNFLCISQHGDGRAVAGHFDFNSLRNLLHCYTFLMLLL